MDWWLRFLLTSDAQLEAQTFSNGPGFSMDERPRGIAVLDARGLFFALEVRGDDEEEEKEGTLALVV